MRLILENASQLKFKENMLWIGVMTLATVFIWVSYSVYSAVNKSTIDPNVNKLLTPLNPNLDQELLADLDNRFKPADQFTIYALSGEQGSSQLITIPPRN